MYINLESDYAVRILIYLCKQNKRVKTVSISSQTGVTQRFAHKILRKLQSSGIIKSYKGSNGGYELLKSPTEISLLEIIELVEGRYSFSRCLNDNLKSGTCSCENDCKVQEVYKSITSLVRQKLKIVTLNDLI